MDFERREPLMQGMTLALKKDDDELKFDIEHVISYGENGIVYMGKVCSAEDSFAKKTVLKEFYPVSESNAGIYRNLESGCLVLPDNRAEDFISRGRELFEGVFPFTEVAEGNNTIYAYTDTNEVITLREWKEDGKQLTGEIIAKTMSSVCEYIRKVHDGGALYLNCNPESIYFVRGKDTVLGKAHMFDFAAVKNRNTAGYHYHSYMDGWAPFEQVFEEKRYIDVQTDIYAVGAMFFWMLTGKKVDIKEDHDDKESFFLWDKYSMLIESTDISVELIKKILMKSLHNAWNNRYINMTAMKKDFDKLARKYAEEEAFEKYKAAWVAHYEAELVRIYAEKESIDSHLQGNESDIRIIVIGIGSAGNQFINWMIDEQIGGLEFIAVNTDQQALQVCKAPKLLQIGEKLTKGLGTGARPGIGEKAAEESSEEIRDAIRGASMVFICCGMGGGMGTGGSPVVARIAKEMGICTMGFVMKPFRFEARPRMGSAMSGIALLEQHTDALLTLSNDVLFKVADKRVAMPEVLAMGYKVISQGMLGIKNLITPNTINCKSLAELCDIMRGKGLGYIGWGTEKGEGRTIAALQMAINSPWLEKTSIKEAPQVLLYLYGDISKLDAFDAMQHIREMAGHDNIAYGVRYDENKLNEVTVVVIAFEGSEKTSIRVNEWTHRRTRRMSRWIEDRQLSDMPEILAFLKPK